MLKSTHATRRAEAAMVLARHYAALCGHARTVELVRIARQARRATGIHRRAWVMEIHALLNLGRLEEARSTLAEASRVIGDGDPSLCAMDAACHATSMVTDTTSISLWPGALNKLLEQARFAPLSIGSSSHPPSLANIAACAPSLCADAMPVKVSVLMAVHNRAETLEYAVASVLAQTWSRLELIIVDDVSTDGSWELIKHLAARDSRIIALKHETNAGAYAARNTALHNATGHYITVHDADDWSHPQKIEAQVTALLQDATVVGNTTSWIRVLPGLKIQPRFDDPEVPIIHRNYSSFMVARETAIKLNGWDVVRTSADAEFIDRIRRLHGGNSVKDMYPAVPLALSLLEGNNLTSNPGTNLRTFYFGARHEYARHYHEWHSSGASLVMQRTSQRHPFPVAGIQYAGKGHRAHFHVILISSLQSEDAITACLIYTKNIALLHWPEGHPVKSKAIRDVVTPLCREHGIIPLVHGESTDCDLLIVEPDIDPHHLPDALPKITARHLLVLQPPTIEGSAAIDTAGINTADLAFRKAFSLSPQRLGLTSLPNYLSPRQS